MDSGSSFHAEIKFKCIQLHVTIHKWPMAGRRILHAQSRQAENLLQILSTTKSVLTSIAFVVLLLLLKLPILRFFYHWYTRLPR